MNLLAVCAVYFGLVLSGPGATTSDLDRAFAVADYSAALSTKERAANVAAIDGIFVKMRADLTTVKPFIKAAKAPCEKLTQPAVEASE